jgi:hypothetical protein
MEFSGKPSCKMPYNKSLHQIGSKCGETIVISNENNLKKLSVELQMSQPFAVLSHQATNLVSSFIEIDMVSIRTQNMVFAFLPKVHPRLSEKIGKELQKFGKVQTVFVHKGNPLLRFFCMKVFHWEPRKVVDIFDICLGKGWGPKNSWDLITGDIVGGEFCRRGWNFHANYVPSAMVMKHRLIQVSLIYEFGSKQMQSKAQLNPSKAGPTSNRARPNGSKSRPNSNKSEPNSIKAGLTPNKAGSTASKVGSAPCKPGSTPCEMQSHSSKVGSNSITAESSSSKDGTPRNDKRWIT